MSLKAIELQVALPRTNTVGKVQNQLNQKPLVEQHDLALQSKAKQELDRSRLSHVNETKGSIISRDQNKERHREDDELTEKKEQARKQSKVASPSLEPHKGKHVDLLF